MTQCSKCGGKMRYRSGNPIQLSNPPIVPLTCESCSQVKTVKGHIIAGQFNSPGRALRKGDLGHPDTDTKE